MNEQDWYKRATGNKAPQDVTFTVRMGSAWLRLRDDYVRAIKAQENALIQQRNMKASRALRYHRRSLPKTLPYEVVVTGFEWPLVASALLAAGRSKEDRLYASQVQSLYFMFLRTKREKTYELRDSKEGLDTQRTEA